MFFLFFINIIITTNRYLIIGLAITIYNLINEVMNHSKISESEKEEIYYQLIVYFVIGLDILCGLLKFLGFIFMIILVKLFSKIRMSKNNKIS